jgi:hypothetical protein
VPDSESTRNGAESVDHSRYIDRYLSADADDDFDRAELRAAQAHVDRCVECRQRIAAENAMKSETQSLAAVKAPGELRDRILAALDEEDRSAQVRVRRNRRALTLIAVGLVAAAILAVIIFRIYRPSIPAFDSAIASFEKSERSFTPNVPSKSAGELAVAFVDQFGVPMAWDFSSLGLRSMGGRIEHTADGNTVGYSLYQGARGSLLCVIYRDDSFQFPPGGEVVNGIHVYEYKGYSIAATNRHAILAIMVTRLPAAELVQTFAQLRG